MTNTILIFVLAVVVVAAVMYYVFRRTQAQEPAADPYTYIEGLRALLRGQDELAFARLKDTITADSGNVDAYIRLGNILRRKKRLQQALQVHRDLTFRPNLTAEEKREILEALYFDFIELKDDASAVKAIHEITALNPNDRFALEALLRAHEKAGEWKEAAVVRKKLDKVSGGDSNKTLAFYKVLEGEELSKQGDPHRARLFFKEAIHFDKLCLAAYIAIGDSYYNEKRLEDALEYWTKVTALKPEDGHLVFDRLKKGFFEVGRYGSYADVLNELISACPEHLTARLELAYFLEKKGETDTAREHYAAAIDNHPDSMLARLGLYRLNLTTDKREAAEATFKQIMKLAVKKEAGNYQCSQCGLQSESKLWLCPRCKAVDSYVSVKA